MKQMAYARRIWGAKGTDKKGIALDVGYSRFVANSAKSKIEDHKGFNNAMAALAADSNNVALQILHEFKSRGVKDFSNKDLVSALNAIGGAWSKFTTPLRNPEGDKKSNNKLRTVILQRVENQTVSPGAEIEALPPGDVLEDVTEEDNEQEF